MFDKFLSTISSNYKSPLMIFDLHSLRTNIKHIKDITSHLDIIFVFPVKAFPSSKVLKLFAEFKFGFDVSNLNEYDLVKDLITADNLVTSCGPLAHEFATIADRIRYPSFLVNADSISQYKELSNKLTHTGIRVNFNNQKGFTLSHFGFEDISHIPNHIKNSVHTMSFHIIDIRNDDFNKKLLQILEKNIFRYPNLKFLNIGGHFTEFDNLTLCKYLKNIRSVVSKHIKILIEPGDFWFKNVGYILTKVIYTKNLFSNKQFVFLDISRDAHMKWSAPSFNKSVVLNATQTYDSNHSVLFYGCSCYENDFIEIIKTNQVFSKNDILLFSQITGYSYSWNTGFNGIPSINVKYYDE